MKKIKTASKLALVIGVFAICNTGFSQIENDTIVKVATENIISTDSIVSVESMESIDSLTIKEPSRLKFGLGLGLNFVGGTNISISPNLNYAVSDKIAFGVGLQGSYASIKDLQSTTTFGANVLWQYNPSRKIMTLLELVPLRVSTKTESTNITQKYWDTALFVGVGYNITSKISVGAKYNMLYNDEESVYSSPIIPFVNISF